MLELNLSIYFFIFMFSFIATVIIAWRKNSELALTLAIVFQGLTLLEGFYIL